MLPKDTVSSSRISSPCRRDCCLDGQDICIGCLRSLEEILAWHYMSDAQKNDLLETLKLRTNNGLNIK